MGGRDSIHKVSSGLVKSTMCLLACLPKSTVREYSSHTSLEVYASLVSKAEKLSGDAFARRFLLWR